MLLPWICRALNKEVAGVDMLCGGRQDESVCVNVNIFASGMSLVVAALRSTGFCFVLFSFSV